MRTRELSITVEHEIDIGSSFDSRNFRNEVRELLVDRGLIMRDGLTYRVNKDCKDFYIDDIIKDIVDLADRNIEIYEK